MHTKRKMNLSFSAYLIAGLILAACAAVDGQASVVPEPTPMVSETQAACPVTQGEWTAHPEDSAVLSTPVPGYYIINADRSIWVGAYWLDEMGRSLHAGEEGNKMGWFRPEGAELTVSGRRLDGEAPALTFEAPCCYPTRFQASGLYFPSEGCWELTANAAESELTFIVWVQP
jgi:hypothetical protein